MDANHELIDINLKAINIDKRKKVKKQTIVLEKDWDRKYVFKECYICHYESPKELNIKAAMANMQQHYFSKHLIKVNAYRLKCRYCKDKPAFFNTMEQLEQHNSNYHKCNLSLNMTEVLDPNENSSSKSLSDSIKYRCFHCKSQISTFEDVLKHYKEASLGTWNICFLCRKKVPDLRGHLICHKPAHIKYLCHYCLLCFNDIKEFDLHNEKTDHTMWQCHLCSKSFSFENEKIHLKAHQKNYLNESICHVCGDTLSNWQNLLRHLKVLHEGVRFSCSQCSLAYTTKGALKIHIKKVHGNQAKIIEIIDENRKETYQQRTKRKTYNVKCTLCEKCGKSLKGLNKEQIREHQLLHRFICLALDCKQTFPDKESRLNHLENDHKQLSCNECKNKKIFYDDLSFKVHNEWHLWINAANHFTDDQPTCRICNDKYESFTELASHLKKVHYLYICLKHKQCNRKIFASKNFFYTHNYGKVLFQCKVCTRKFRFKASLSSHEKGHLKIRKHKCSVCDATFNTTAQLKIHFRTHTGEKPYQCRYCVKKFAVIHNRKLHERLHTGEKPYKCIYCDKRFADPSRCKAHQKNHKN